MDGFLPKGSKMKNCIFVIGLLVSGIACLESQGHAQALDPKKPPPVIGSSSGSGGSGSGGSAAGGSASSGAAGGAAGGGGAPGGGYDGYNDIDWDGPDEVAISPLAFEPVAVNGLIDLCKMTTRGIPASVRPQPRKYEDAIQIVEMEIEKRGTAGPNAGVVARLEATASTPHGIANLGRVAATAAIAGHLDFALAALLARLRAAPQDPTVLYNISSLLVQRRMPNEALAIIDYLKKSGKMPVTPFDYQPDASIDYLRGYALLMIGQLQDSIALLRKSFAADPTLTDASYALALAESTAGQDPRKALLQGMLRAYHGPLIYCGDKYQLDPLTTDEDQNVGPPADKIFDLSKGKDGVLPNLMHPGSGPQLIAMIEESRHKRQTLEDEVLTHSKKADDLYTRLSARLDKNAPDAADLTAQALVDMLDEANACLKPLQRMFEEKNRALEEMSTKVSEQINTMEPDFRALLETTDNDASRAIWRGMLQKSLGSRHGAIGMWDAAVRRHFKSWHRYATGLAGHLTDPEWREYADEKIRAAAAAEWLSLYMNVIGNYAAGIAAAPELYAPANVTPAATAVPPQELWRCDPAHRKASIEGKIISIKGDEWPRAKSGAFPDLGVSFKANCDKIAVEADAKLGVDMGPFKAALGGFIEVAVDRAGDITVYGGPKFNAETNPGPVALGGSVKDGMYITFDADGIKEVGGRIDLSNAASAGSLKGGLKGDDMTFPIWTAPPRPPKFDKQSGRTIWKNL